MQFAQPHHVACLIWLFQTGVIQQRIVQVRLAFGLAQGEGYLVRIHKNHNSGV